MLPLELKKDCNNLFYLDNPHMLGYMFPFHNYHNLFFVIVGVKDFIVKYYNEDYSKRDQLKDKEMILNLLSLQSKFKDIDFPIGYYKRGKNLKGIIVPYYNSPSLKNIVETCELGELSKYYYHDDDEIHNLFKLYLDILEMLEQLFIEKIYYIDINVGNFVFENNCVKLIDFDHNYIYFNTKEKESLRSIINNYSNLIYLVSRKFRIGTYFIEQVDSFNETKVMVKKLENRVRKEYLHGI